MSQSTSIDDSTRLSSSEDEATDDGAFDPMDDLMHEYLQVEEGLLVVHRDDIDRLIEEMLGVRMLLDVVLDRIRAIGFFPETCHPRAHLRPLQ